MRHVALRTLLSLVAIGLLLLLLTGCDSLFGGGEDDGTLTVSLTGAAQANDETTGDKKAIFIVAILPGGGDPETTDPVAIIGTEISGGEAQDVARVPGDGDPSTLPEWNGSGGSSYDVYPLVYYVTDAELDEGGDFWTECDHWVYKSDTEDWGEPISYEQDGNASFATVFSDYHFNAGTNP